MPQNTITMIHDYELRLGLGGLGDRIPSVPLRFTPL